VTVSARQRHSPSDGNQTGCIPAPQITVMIEYRLTFAAAVEQKYTRTIDHIFVFQARQLV